MISPGDIPRVISLTDKQTYETNNKQINKHTNKQGGRQKKKQNKTSTSLLPVLLEVGPQ